MPALGARSVMIKISHRTRRRVPASVALIAITSQMRFRSESPSTNGLSAKTAGTLLMTLESTAVSAMRT